MGLLSRLFGCKKTAEKSESAYTAPSTKSVEETSEYTIDKVTGRRRYKVELKGEHSVTSSIDLNDEQIMAYFRDVLVTEFPEYTIKENVEVTELVGDANDSFQLYKSRPYQVYKAEWGQPYSFVIYKCETLKAVVMLGDKRSHHERVKFLISRVYAKKIDVPYLGFYTHFDNNIDYIVARINKCLNE